MRRVRHAGEAGGRGVQGISIVAKRVDRVRVQTFSACVFLRVYVENSASEKGMREREREDDCDWGRYAGREIEDFL